MQQVLHRGDYRRVLVGLGRRSLERVSQLHTASGDVRTVSAEVAARACEERRIRLAEACAEALDDGSCSSEVASTGLQLAEERMVGRTCLQEQH